MEKRIPYPDSIRRVCIFCETWGSGGIESYLFNVLTAMDLSGLEIDIVAARLEDSVFMDELQRLGIAFRTLSGNLRDIQGNHAGFRDLLVERGYDAVYLNICHGLSLYYAHAAHRAGVPVRIAHAHGADLRPSRSKPIKLLLHRLARKYYACACTDFFACSANAAKFLFPAPIYSQNRYEVIPNGIDTDRFRFSQTGRDALRRELGLAEAYIVGYVGRICPQKNQSFLLEVFSRLKRLRPDSVLILVGDGEDRAFLEARAQELGLAQSVWFTGTVSQVEQWLWTMDIFAFPSTAEGFGMVAIEAQAAGLPILCSENIPTEAFVTPLAKNLSLSAGEDAWAKALAVGGACPNWDRKMGADLVCQAGFTLQNTADRVASLLWEIRI